MVFILRRRFHNGIFDNTSSNFGTSRQNNKQERLKKTALKHRTSMNECHQKSWR